MNEPAVDPLALRRCLGSFVTGVTVVTALADDGQPLGMTVNSFNSVSLDPPLVLWSLGNRTGSYDVFSRARRFVINILAEDQIEISQRFARPGPDRFAGIGWQKGLEGLPLIENCVAHLECRTEVTYPSGDHLLFLGRVERMAHLPTQRPLAFGAGRYMVVQPHDPFDAPAVERGPVASLSAVHAARPLVEALSRETGRAVGLGVWGSHGPTLIWWAESGEALPEVQLHCGNVLPLLGSATGLVFATWAPRETTARWLEAEMAERAATPGTALADASAVEARLADVRARGLANIAEAELARIRAGGLNSVSVPVFDVTGAVVLALTMIGRAPGFGVADPAVARLADAAARLSARLGHRPSAPAIAPASEVRH